MRRPLAAALSLIVCLRVAPAFADASVVDVPAQVPTTAPTPPTTPPLPAEAARSRPPTGPHSGVMWRVLLGGAYMHGWSTSAGMSRTASAFPALAFSVSMGHAVSPNVVLQMDINYARSGGATYSSEGETIVDDVSLSSVLLGVGLTYWIPEYDVYFNGGVGFAQMSTVSGAFHLGTIEIPDIESTGLGVGAHAGVGKQWRVGRRWGIGPLFQLSFMSAPQTIGDANHLKLVTATLSISATYD